MGSLSLVQFADEMNRIMPVLLKEFARRQVNKLYEGRLTLPQFLVLDFLSVAPVAKMKDLADFMRVSTAAMTGIIDRLVREGLVEREPDKTDRRIIKIRLTAEGRELVKRSNEERRKMMVAIFGKISESDRREYLRIIQKVRDILIAMRNDND